MNLRTTVDAVLSEEEFEDFKDGSSLRIPLNNQQVVIHPPELDIAEEDIEGEGEPGREPEAEAET